jgi:hypothetical protein
LVLVAAEAVHLIKMLLVEVEVLEHLGLERISQLL